MRGKLEPGSIFFCRRRSASIGALLILLGTGAPLRAHCGPDRLGLQENSARSESSADLGLRRSTSDLLEPRFLEPCAWALSCADPFVASETLPSWTGPQLALTKSGNEAAQNSTAQSKANLRTAHPTDPNQEIYYKNKFEFGLDVGWLPINIPFVFDFLLGDGYNETGLNYTLVPVIASLRWHLGDLKGPVVLRGNWDVMFSLSATAIPRGPESRYFACIMGIRRNFVPRRWIVAPYVDTRAGLGDIDAKGSLGVRFAQGQNFTFTLNLGSGIRYNINPRYAVSAGLNWMHISNLYLSQPKFLNYGINVYGPMVGIDVRLGRHRRD